jgi:hypothetical protein
VNIFKKPKRLENIFQESKRENSKNPSRLNDYFIYDLSFYTKHEYKNDKLENQSNAIINDSDINLRELITSIKIIEITTAK